MKPRYSYVESLASNLSSNKTIPLDVQNICKELNIHYHEENLDNVSGASVVDGNLKHVFVNINEPETRKRFTGAHEVAHLLLHGDQAVNYNSSTPFVLFRDSNEKSPDWREREANYFAACLIMPSKELLSKIEKYKNTGISDEDINIIAEDFGVSSQAMSIRLAQMGILSY